MSEMKDLDEQLARAAARCRKEMKHALEHSFDQEACLKALFGAAEEYAGARVYIAQARKIREKRVQAEDPGLS